MKMTFMIYKQIQSWMKKTKKKQNQEQLSFAR